MRLMDARVKQLWETAHASRPHERPSRPEPLPVVRRTERVRHAGGGGQLLVHERDDRPRGARAPAAGACAPRARRARSPSVHPREREDDLRQDQEHDDRLEQNEALVARDVEHELE